MISEEEAAKRIGIALVTLRRWRKEGKVDDRPAIPFYKIGALFRYKVDDIDNYIKSCRVGGVGNGY